MIAIDVKNIVSSGVIIKNNIVDTITTPDAGGNGTAQAIYLEAGPDNVQTLDNDLRNVHSNRSAKGVLITPGVLVTGNSVHQ